MNKTPCASCFNPKSTHTCDQCGVRICKKCLQQNAASDYPLMQKVPAILEKEIFCPSCFDKDVLPLAQDYQAKEQAAHNLTYFSKIQSKETRLMSRKEPAITIKDCHDRQEVILKLAFMTVEMNFNSMIDVDTVSEKLRNGGYQTLRWSGSAVPVNLDLEKLELREKRRLS